VEYDIPDESPLASLGMGRPIMRLVSSEIAGFMGMKQRSLGNIK